MAYGMSPSEEWGRNFKWHYLKYTDRETVARQVLFGPIHRDLRKKYPKLLNQIFPVPDRQTIRFQDVVLDYRAVNEEHKYMYDPYIVELSIGEHISVTSELLTESLSIQLYNSLVINLPGTPKRILAHCFDYCTCDKYNISVFRRTGKDCLGTASNRYFAIACMRGKQVSCKGPFFWKYSAKKALKELEGSFLPGVRRQLTFEIKKSPKTTETT